MQPSAISFNFWLLLHIDRALIFKNKELFESLKATVSLGQPCLVPDLTRLGDLLKKTNFGPEVDKVCKALEICNGVVKMPFVEIFQILTMVCETHKLALAQTWVPCKHRRVLADGGGGVKKSCRSFDGSCQIMTLGTIMGGSRILYSGWKERWRACCPWCCWCDLTVPSGDSPVFNQEAIEEEPRESYLTSSTVEESFLVVFPFPTKQ
ncbi:hypothetical protein IFM89_009092 [Coptis chinensis]|uniref:NLP1-9 GAF domain-containing protein n=1 Tax=Coptis chinensis TaxID=261450 RepID=A0A835M5B8_9MAGN|nr:hypothetical protein IFM89_009092 [Coptis chinensis]